MAKIILNNRKKEIKDNSMIKEACKKLGIPFSCEHGTCATCLIKVKKGIENLNEKTEAEIDMGITNIDKDLRLACQCTINSGEVEIEEF